MNKNIIIALVFIAVGIFVFLNMSKDVSTYENFSGALKKDGLSKVVGELARDKPMVYDAENNPNEFRFFMKDGDGIEKEILLKKPKPQDFEMSEQVVVTGKMDQGVFVATEILTKCPSKYKEEEIAIKGVSQG